MIAYVDASVLLRFALGQPDVLPEWRQIERGVSSTLVRTESLRTLDRLRLRANLANAEVAKRRATILTVIASLEVVDIGAAVLDRAAQPMPTELGTLESPPNSNRTKYGAWYGFDGFPWCAMFVSWVYDKAGSPLGKIGRDTARIPRSGGQRRALQRRRP